MKASPSEQYKLLELQRVDDSIAKNKQLIAQLNAQDTALQIKAKHSELRKALNDSVNSIEEIQSDLKKIENDVELVANRIVRDEKLLTQSQNAKDTQGIEAELESLKTRKYSLEDNQLEILEQLENQNAIKSALDAEAAQIETQLAGFAAEKSNEIAALEAVLSQLLAERNLIAADILPELLDLYQRQADRYGIGASWLIGKVSSAIGVELSVVDFTEIQAKPADEVVICPESQAILVRK